VDEGRARSDVAGLAMGGAQPAPKNGGWRGLTSVEAASHVDLGLGAKAFSQARSIEITNEPFIRISACGAIGGSRRE